VVWPKLHEDGRGPLNLGLPPPHPKKVAQVTEGAEGAYTLKEAMRLTVQSRPWNEVGPPVGSGFWVAPQPGTSQHGPASSDRPAWFQAAPRTHTARGPGPFRWPRGAVCWRERLPRLAARALAGGG
jgi:hypothetical protein